MRATVMQIVGWAFAALCAIYVICPIDVLPEAILGPLGFADDFGTLISGIGAAMAALRAGEDKAAMAANKGPWERSRN